MTAISMEELARPARRFVGWWLAELSGMVPVRIRRFLDGRLGGHVLLLEGGEAVLLRRTATGETVVSRVDLALPGAAFAAKGLPRRARVRLAPARALRAQLALPLAAEENLDEVLGFELDRRTPFRPEDVYFTHRIEARDEHAGLLRLELVVVPHRLADEALAAAVRLGLEPDGLEVGAPDPMAEPYVVTLASGAEGRGRRVTLLRAAAALAFLATAAAAYASTLPVSRDGDALRRQVEALREQAAAADRLRERIGRLREADAALAARGSDHLAANVLVNELTRLLPDDTWIEQFRFTGGKVALTGYSQSSATVVRLLEESALFETPRFSSPVTQEPGLGREKFNLTATVKGVGK